MGIKRKPRKCKDPDCEKSGFFQTGYCSAEHFYRNKKPKAKKPGKKIKPVSDKRAARLKEYYAKRDLYLAEPENKFCACGCKAQADTVEHTRGREHDVFWDDYARENNLPLLLDHRWWKPFNSVCNQKLERDAAFSHQHQLSKLHNGKKGDLKGKQ